MLPLMEKEDIRGSYTSHDPDQPAHVARPGAELPQHQPGGTHHTYIIIHYAPAHWIRCPSDCV